MAKRSLRSLPTPHTPSSCASDRGIQPEKVRVPSTVALDDVDSKSTLISPALVVHGRIPGLDSDGCESIADEATALCRISQLFAGATIIISSNLEVMLVSAADGVRTGLLIFTTALSPDGVFVIMIVARVPTSEMDTAPARRMTQLQRRALDQPRNTATMTRARHGTVHADVLRGLIFALSLTLLAPGVRIAV